MFELIHNEDLKKIVFYFLQRTESYFKLENQSRGVCMCITIYIYILYVGCNIYNMYIPITYSYSSLLISGIVFEILLNVPMLGQNSF